MKTMDDSTRPADATPGEDISGLKQQYLITQQDRNAAELEAIMYAYQKYVFKPKRKLTAGNWLSDGFIKEVHLDMFGTIWDWAGRYRTQNVNIGIAFQLIQEQIASLCGDFEYWNSQNSDMPIIEVAARLQNRLTRIHPFTNGNGRHARLLTDIYFSSKDHLLPKWPQIQLSKQGNDIRSRYISAMKKADFEDYSPLIKFIYDCIQ